MLDEDILRMSLSQLYLLFASQIEVIDGKHDASDMVLIPQLLGDVLGLPVISAISAACQGNHER